MRGSILALLPLMIGGLTAKGQYPQWARDAKPFYSDCLHYIQNIPSPNRSAEVVVSCRLNDEKNVVYSLNVIRGGGPSREIQLEWGAKELFWAPNSKSFVINSGESSYSGFTTLVYTLTAHGIETRSITDRAQKEMVARFPPCKAAYQDAATCKLIKADPKYNMSAVGWSTNSSSLMVFAEFLAAATTVALCARSRATG